MIFDKQNPLGLTCRDRGQSSRCNLGLSFFARRKNELKCGAFVPAGALRSDSSLVRFDKLLADGEAKTQSSKLCPATLFKSIENFRQCFRLNSQARVRDFNKQLSIGIVARGNGNLSLLRCEFHGVIYQVPKDLLQPRRVYLQMNFPCAEIEGTRQMFSIDFRLANLQCILQQGMSVNDFKIELHLTPIDAS